VCPREMKMRKWEESRLQGHVTACYLRREEKEGPRRKTKGGGDAIIHCRGRPTEGGGKKLEGTFEGETSGRPRV